MTALQIVADNLATLIAGGELERAFALAYSKIGHSDPATVQLLLSHCDRGKLRAAGSPFPDIGPLVVYRGVSNRPGRQRIERGLSWTLSRDYACVFASQGSDGVVLSATVPGKAVYFYHDPTWEQHVCCDVTEYRDLRLSAAEIRAGCDQFAEYLKKAGPAMGPAFVR